LETSALFATQLALACKAKPVLQLKHVAGVAVKQVAQLVPHGVAVVEVKMVETHAAVPVYPAPQAVQVIAGEVAVTVHAEQPTTGVVAVTVAGEDKPVEQL